LATSRSQGVKRGGPALVRTGYSARSRATSADWLSGRARSRSESSSVARAAWLRLSQHERVRRLGRSGSAGRLATAWRSEQKRAARRIGRLVVVQTGGVLDVRADFRLDAFGVCSLCGARQGPASGSRSQHGTDRASARTLDRIGLRAKSVAELSNTTCVSEERERDERQPIVLFNSRSLTTRQQCRRTTRRPPSDWTTGSRRTW
jgi:hypothetical protein